MPIKVLLVDDHQIIQAGLKSVLSKQMDIEVVGEAENGREAVETALRLQPEIIVMDIGMPQLNGIDATKEILGRLPDVRVIALSMHSDRRYVSEMLAAGASGYLLKDCAFDELTQAIRAVSGGRTYLSECIAGVVLEDYRRHLNGEQLEGAPALNGLSGREREVLQLIGEGLSTKQIAGRLHLSTKTIETHRRQVMDKLGIYTLAGLIKFAVKQGLAELD